MSLLNKIVLDKINNQIEELRNVKGRCYDCGGYFSIEELETELESEDWPNQIGYVIYICPVCEDGGSIEI